MQNVCRHNDMYIARICVFIKMTSVWNNLSEQEIMFLRRRKEDDSCLKEIIRKLFQKLKLNLNLNVVIHFFKSDFR